ncbi:MAG: zinc-ribbon domain-containing protein [Xanthobacteraceae bacterium]
MQIICPSCTTTYDLAPTALGGNGRSVRCTRCRNVWFATPTAEPVEASVAAVEGDSSVPQDPMADEALSQEGTPSGEFEWSLEQTPVENESAEPAKAPDLPAGTNPAQGSVEAVWPAVDTHPTALAEAPSLVPALEGEKIAKPEPHPEPENIEMVAARRVQRATGRRQWKLPQLKLPRWKPKLAWPGMPATIAALVVAVAGLVIWRGDVVRTVPQTASLFDAIGLQVNLRGLVFDNVRTTGELHDGVPVLIIEGTIANVAGKTVEVPRLRFAMRNRAGHEVYAWTSVTGRSILAAGETAAFRTRLASPPADGRDVIVRFFNRRDFLAGMR